MHRPHPFRSIRNYMVWLSKEPGMPYADYPFSFGDRAPDSRRK